MKSKQMLRAPTKVTDSPELEKEAGAIADLLTQGEDEHWQIGAHYNAIVNGRLAQKAGYKSARKFFEERLGQVSQATLTLYGAIAKTFTEEAAKTYGSSRLGRLLTYERLREAKLPAGDPGDIPIDVPQMDGSTKEKRFADCTFAELVAALHRRQSPPEPVPPEDKAILKRLHKGLEDEYGADDGAKLPIVIKARNDPHIGTVVVLDVAIEHLDRLRNILVKLLGKSSTEAVSRNGRPRISAAGATKNGHRRSIGSTTKTTPKRSLISHSAKGASSRRAPRRPARRP